MTSIVVQKRNVRTFEAERWEGQSQLLGWNVITTLADLEPRRSGMSSTQTMDNCVHSINNGGGVVIVASCVVLIRPGQWLVGATAMNEADFWAKYEMAT
jgi:hypothetical protein